MALKNVTNNVAKPTTGKATAQAQNEIKKREASISRTGLQLFDQITLGNRCSVMDSRNFQGDISLLLIEEKATGVVTSKPPPCSSRTLDVDSYTNLAQFYQDATNWITQQSASNQVMVADRSGNELALLVIFAYNMTASETSLTSSLQTLLTQITPEWFSPRHHALVTALIQFERKTLGSVSSKTPEDLFVSKYVNSKVRAKASASKRIAKVAAEEAMEEDSSLEEAIQTETQPRVVYRALPDMSAFANEEETISCD